MKMSAVKNGLLLLEMYVLEPGKLPWLPPKITSDNRDSRAIFRASHFADEFAYVLLCRAKPSKPLLFPLKSSLKFVLHLGKPKFTSLPVEFPADRSKFQFCTTALSIS